MTSTMPDPEILVGIAALGLTVTGFSGLISVLGRRSTGQWSDVERFQLGELIVVSLAVTFTSFIPVLAALIQDTENALYTALFLVALFHFFVLVRGAFRNYRGGPSAPNVPNSMAVFMMTGGLLLIGSGFLSSFGVINGAGFFLVANLLWQLLVATIHFVLLLMNTGTPDDS